MPFSQITSNINFPPLALPARGKFRVIVTSLSLKITPKNYWGKGLLRIAGGSGPYLKGLQW